MTKRARLVYDAKQKAYNIEILTEEGWTLMMGWIEESGCVKADIFHELGMLQKRGYWVDILPRANEQ